MKKLFVLFAMAGAVHAATVNTVTVSVDDTTKLVTVTYTLSGSGQHGATVSMEASADNGVTWNVPVQTTYGDVGADIMDGSGQQIYWDAGQDWENNESSQMKVRVLAAQQTSNGSAVHAHHTNCRIPVTGCTIDWALLEDDDGELQLGRPFSFTDNGNGTVTDNNTGLTWIKDLSGSACNNGSMMSFKNAENWAENLSYAGYSDWRMASEQEAIMLMDFSEQGTDIMPGWMIHSDRKSYWLGGMQPGGYLSGYAAQLVFNFDNHLNSVGRAYQVMSGSRDYIGDGLFETNYTYLATHSGGIMLVRGDDQTKPQIDNSEECLKDAKNRLMWGYGDSLIRADELGAAYGQYLSVNQLNGFVDQVNQASWKGYSDWRIPNIKELSTFASMRSDSDYFTPQSSTVSPPHINPPPCNKAVDECNYSVLGLTSSYSSFSFYGYYIVLVRTY